MPARTNRRAHARYAVGFGAEIHTERGMIAAGTRDVSRGGCQLRAGRPLPEGATVRIDLCLTVDGIQEVDFPRLTVMGRIQWTAEAGDDEGGFTSGVRFDGMTAAQADWLEQILIKHGTPEPAPPASPADVEIEIDI